MIKIEFNHKRIALSTLLFVSGIVWLGNALSGLVRASHHTSRLLAVSPWLFGVVEVLWFGLGICMVALACANFARGRRLRA